MTPSPATQRMRESALAVRRQMAEANGRLYNIIRKCEAALDEYAATAIRALAEHAPDKDK